MPSATPADVLARRRHVILNGDADGFADLFAPDAVMEVPFAGLPGMPARVDRPGGDPRARAKPPVVAAATGQL